MGLWYLIIGLAILCGLLMKLLMSSNSKLAAEKTLSVNLSKEIETLKKQLEIANTTVSVADAYDGLGKDGV